MQVETDKVIDWIENGVFPEDIDRYVNRSSIAIKDVVFLALLELGEDVSATYDDIKDVLVKNAAAEGGIDVLALRNGISQIKNDLTNDPTYELEQGKKGKQSYFKIKKRDTTQNAGGATEGVGVIEIFKADPSTSMHIVAERFVRDRRMPFYGIYLPLRGAGRWVFYSEMEEKAWEKKRKHEGDECERLLGKWLIKQEGKILSIVSLGVGEGIGEIEIIERLLEKYRFESIHYCAIDTNIYLLMDHATRLRNIFRSQIAERKLICTVVRGNFLTHFSDLITVVKEEVKRQFRDANFDFLPDNSGKIISILGNVIGNLEHRASEWTYFHPILEEFKGQDLAFLLGIGVRQTDGEGNSIDEKYPLDDLFLSTLRYLTYDLRILKSTAVDEDMREFYPQTHETEETEETEANFTMARNPYQGDGFIGDAHVSGDIYEFIYTLMGTLSMKLETEEIEALPGAKFLLYNIIKFDLENFRIFLESKGLFLNKKIEEFDLGDSKNKQKNRVYAVLAALTKPLP